MNKFLRRILFLSLCLVPLSAWGQSGNTTLQTEVTTQFANNTSNAVTLLKFRTMFNDIILSYPNLVDHGTTGSGNIFFASGGTTSGQVLLGTPTFGIAGSVTGTIDIAGSTSGTKRFTVGAATSGTLKWQSGDMDFTATGGTSQVVKQTSVGAAFTVARLACSDLSDAASGCSAASGITALTGDGTATGPGSAALTLATVNGNVGTFGSATQSVQFTVNGKGLITAAANVTVTPAIGSVTGMGTGVSAFLITPSSANLGTAVTDETGSPGLLVFNSAPVIASAVLTGTPTVGVAGSSQGQIDIAGVTSGTHRFTVPAAASGTTTWPNGTTDFSATGGTSQVVKQTSSGGAFTVARLACADLSDAAASCSAGITALTGDVTASGSGSVAATLATAQPAVHTWALAQTFTVAPVFTDASGSRTALGLGALSTVTPGTGVATALAVNIGTAGSFVVNGGALGSPSSAGTIPAFTLGGTISGGGNGINNIVIGATTPLAGTFTVVNAAAGTVSAPGFGFTGDTNTGFFENGTGIIDVASNGAARIRLRASQIQMTNAVQLGWAASGSALGSSLDMIMTRAAAASLQLGAVSGDTTPGAGQTTQTLQVQGVTVGGTSDQAGASLVIASGQGKGSATPSTMTFTVYTNKSSGTVLHAASSPLILGATGTDGSQNSAVLMRINEVSIGNAAISMYSGEIFGWNSSTVALGTTSVDSNFNRASAGIINVGTTAANASGSLVMTNLTATGAAIIHSGLASDAANTDNTVCVKTSDGTLLKGSGTLGICLGTSSAKYKDKISPVPEVMAQLLTLKPKNFFYKKGHGDGGAREQYGFIAEEFVSSFPKLTHLDADKKPMSVDLLGLVPVIVAGMQEQYGLYSALEKQINDLRNEIKELRQAKK